MEPISRDELATALSTALKPLLDEMKEMRSDIGGLKLNSAPRTDVYARDVMDEKIGGLEKSIETVNKAIQASRDFNWKVMGFVGTVVTIFAYFAPHILWRP